MIENRLIDQLREMADRTPPICQYDKPEKTMIFGKEITVYCKPFEQFQELLRRAADALDVDAVEVTEFNEILYKLECLLCHATGGKYSKAGYSLEDMERMVTDYIEECCDEAVEEKVVHGRWVLAKPRVKGRNATYRCTACGKLRSSYYNDVFQWEYCPCGAKMDGDRNA